MDKTGQSLSVAFDDVMRHYDHHMNYNVDSEFLDFVTHQQTVVVKKWQEAEAECVRLQSELEQAHKDMHRTELKIQSARHHLETKIQDQNQLDAALEKMTLRVDSARALIRSYVNDPRVGHDTKDRMYNIMALLEGHVIDDVDAALKKITRSPNGGLDDISEHNSTDVNMTQSEDDLDQSIAARKAYSSRKRQNQKRPSLEFKQPRYTKKQCTPGTKQTVEVSSNDQIVVKTVVSSSKNGGGPIHALASVETHPNKSNKDDVMRPSAPILESDTDSENVYVKSPPQKKTPQAPSSFIKQSSISYASPAYSGPSRTNVSQRPHAFCQKTVIKPETCEPCGKRIKFSKVAFKCRDCKATCHPECKDKVPLPCVMTGTPGGNKHQMGTITDYAPQSHPMVPGLIQHCVQAIEKRGQDIVGLYRVPGPEKEVKDLKEKFLKGKGVPNLLRYDIHVICGCVKDFLRSLQEPLVGRWFWRDFSLASDITDPIKRMNELERIIGELPPANQDSLAYVILHLQRVANYPDVKMPIGNLAKVFGPTVVGYSGSDIDGPTMLKESKKQQQVMESFLTAPATFWESFLYRPEEVGTKLYEGNGSKLSSTSGIFQSTPSKSVLKPKEGNKRIYFDDSPKEQRHYEKQKKFYFDQ